MNDVLNGLKRLVEKELNKIVQKGDLTLAELNVAKEAVCLLKYIDEIEPYEFEDDARYSNDYQMKSRNSSMRGRSPKTGRYVSRDMGMSSHSIKDRAIAALESMVDTAESDYEREEIIKMIDQIRD